MTHRVPDRWGRGATMLIRDAAHAFRPPGPRAAYVAQLRGISSVLNDDTI